MNEIVDRIIYTTETILKCRHDESLMETNAARLHDCLGEAVMLAITVISRITRMPAERYLIYLIFLLLFGLIPAVFLAAEWNRVRLPSFLCVTCSLLLFSAHLVFDGPKMKGELRRRLHL